MTGEPIGVPGLSGIRKASWRRKDGPGMQKLRPTTQGGGARRGPTRRRRSPPECDPAARALLSTRLTWVFTVSSVTTRRAAISVLERPSATRSRTSFLPFGKRRELRLSADHRPQASEIADQPAGDPGREEGVATGHHPHGVEEPLGRHVLEEEAARARTQGVVQRSRPGRRW